MCFPATTKTSVPRRATILLGPLYSVWSEPLRVWCVELCADLGVLKRWNPGEGLDNQLGVWLMVFGMVNSGSCVLGPGDNQRFFIKKQSIWPLISLQVVERNVPHIRSRVGKRGALLLAACSSTLPCGPLNIQSCDYKFTMPAFVQPTVERLDKPSAYYLGRVGISHFSWFDTYTGSLPG